MTWRDLILDEFATQIAPITLVADPDHLLSEPQIQQTLETLGFEWVPYENIITFRFIFESKYRPYWEQGNSINLVVALPTEDSLQTFPYDLLCISRQLSFTLQDIFPKFSYPVLKQLDLSELDVLEQAKTHFPKRPLGEIKTRDFILKHVFSLTPELIKQPADLLQALLRLHYQGITLPESLAERFVQHLSQNATFQGWPLLDVVKHRDMFLQFLQARWPIFIGKQFRQNNVVAEFPSTYTVDGPRELPFDHENVRVYIDNLFLEGFLKPISVKPWNVSAQSVPKKKWFRVGLQLDPDTDRRERIERLLKVLQSEIPQCHERYQRWLTFAPKWAELQVLWHQLLDSQRSALFNAYQTLETDIDRSFLTWVTERYKGLYSQTAKAPVMLHQVPRYLARQLETDRASKLALIVVDGLSLDQWIVLRQVLTQQFNQFDVRENAVFAWLPTVTSVSRQAIFSGMLPMQFAGSIHDTAKEPALWQTFWVDAGLMPRQIGYAKKLGDLSTLDTMHTLLAEPKLRVLGLVVNQVDDIMHGMTLGTAGMHNQVRQWAEQGFMQALLSLLDQQGFTTIITADHGNLEAQGIGRVKEGAIADLRGERVRVYPDEQLRAAALAQCPEGLAWPSTGLPKDYLPLFAPNRKAFIPLGNSSVCHGGISIEELIVPFIQIESVTHDS